MNNRFRDSPDRFRRKRFFAPVKEGEEINVRIDAVGEKGDGIAKVKGFVLIVPETSEGDEVKIKITKVLRKVGFGEVIGDADGPIVEDERPEAQEEINEDSEENPQEEEIEEDFEEEDDSEKKE